MGWEDVGRRPLRVGKPVFRIDAQVFGMVRQHTAPKAECGIGDDVRFAQRHQIEVDVILDTFPVFHIYSITGRYVLSGPFDVVGKYKKLCLRVQFGRFADGLLIILIATQSKVRQIVVVQVVASPDMDGYWENRLPDHRLVIDTLIRQCRSERKQALCVPDELFVLRIIVDEYTVVSFVVVETAKNV